MEVKDVLDKLRGFGLEIQHGTTHYKVHDPVTGAWLFNVSASPSDVNWFWNIKRHCRRLGFPWDPPNKRNKKLKSKRHPAVDLVALKAAQAAARAAGERVPELSDLDEAASDSPLWKTVKMGNTTQLSEAAQEEVIGNMSARAEDARTRLVRGRLKNVLVTKADELERVGRERAEKRGGKYMPPKGEYNVAEFVRTMNDVAEQRNIRNFKSEASAQATINQFLQDDTKSLSIWVLSLIESTVDHLDGLKWGVDATRISTPEAEQEVEPEPEPEPEPVVLIDSNGSDPDLRERYADTLLKLLENTAKRHNVDKTELNLILERLDKLVGLS